ncbi:hypothetical protein ACA910_007946 [Epithemia clementina (nom. ined.)]
MVESVDNKDRNGASCLLSLLSRWSGVNTHKVHLGTRSENHVDDHDHHYNHRGLLACVAISKDDFILTPLPWKHVLGAFASRHLIDLELMKGRGIFDIYNDSDDANDTDPIKQWKTKLLVAAHLNPFQVWSSTLACALLTALRYPLSPWSTYVASLPHVDVSSGAAKTTTTTTANGDDTSTATGQRVEIALRRTHAAIAKREQRLQRMEAKRKQPAESTSLSCNSGSNNSSIFSLEEWKQIQRDLVHQIQTMERPSMNHVLLFSLEELKDTGDEQLISLVQADWVWLRHVWNMLFVDDLVEAAATAGESDHQQPERLAPQASISDRSTATSAKDPIISWESWLWAHAMVRSRAVGLPSAPSFVFAFEYDQFRLPSTVHGVLLPIVDMINHCSSSSSSSSSSQDGDNAALHVTKEGVAVRATRDISVGEEILFDYHPGATLQFFLRSYGFVPNNHGGAVVHTQQFTIGPHWKLRVSRRITKDEYVDSCCTLQQTMMRLHVYLGENQTVALYISNHGNAVQGEEGELLHSIQRFDLLQTCLGQSDGGSYCNHAFFFHLLAANACRVLMQSFGMLSPNECGSSNGETKTDGWGNSSAVHVSREYREATFRLLLEAYQDMECICNAYCWHKESTTMDS